AKTVDGNVTPDRVLSGPDTGLGGNYGIEYDSRTKSILVEDINDAIEIFDDALSADGNVLPSRKIVGANTLLNGGYDLALDERRDLLYATTNQGILVFDNAGTADGDVAPVRVITGAAVPIGGNDHRLALDEKHDRLFIAEYMNSTVLVYDNISTRDGDTAPDRVVTLSSSPWGIALDTKRDILYVSLYSAATVEIFDNASEIDGDIASDRSISGANVVMIEADDMACDPASDMLYLTTGNSQKLMVWHNASTVTGDIAPDRVISGGNTGFSRPVDIVGIN
ncbi:MAG: hypothetical protein P8Y65_06780, partial [Campylobacterales bacterium]